MVAAKTVSFTTMQIDFADLAESKKVELFLLLLTAQHAIVLSRVVLDQMHLS